MANEHAARSTQHAARSTQHAAALALSSLSGLLVVGCASDASDASNDQGQPDPGEVAQDRSAVQLDAVNLYGESGATGFADLLTASASSVHGVLIDAEGSCGMTFISKHYAITAGHCTNLASTAVHPSEAAMLSGAVFDVDTLALQEVVDAAVVSGVWPGWTIADKLTAGEGYLRPGMLCWQARRCFKIDQGPPAGVLSYDVECPAGVHDGTIYSDAALLYCLRELVSPPVPSSWVPISPSDPTSGDVQLFWPHEILDLARWSGDSANNAPVNNWTNYGYLNGTANNYHYTAALSLQQLPLRSADWPAHLGGAKYHIRPGNTVKGWTTVPICHGASGSGFFVAGTSALLGPVAGGMNPNLCATWQDAAYDTEGEREVNRTSYIRPTRLRTFENLPEVQADR